jgi:hypothetical protein
MKIQDIWKPRLILALLLAVVVLVLLFYFLFGQYIQQSDVHAFLDGRTNVFRGLDVGPSIGRNK